MPTDMVDVKDKLYIMSENNKKLIQLDKNTKETKVIDINFGYEYNKIKGQSEEFLDVNSMKDVTLKDGDGGKDFDKSGEWLFVRKYGAPIPIHIQRG